MDRRTREYKDLVKMTPTTQELLTEEIDGELYMYKRASQCKICNTSDDLRGIVDSLLLFPKSYKEVLRAIEPLQEKLNMPKEERINYENIRTHQKNHLPFEKQMVREVVERRAREKNISILDASQRMLTAEAFYEVILAKGWEEIAHGYEKPTLTQTMHAMEMLRAIEKEDSGEYNPEDLIQQLDVILLAIRDVLPQDMKQALYDKIEEYQSGDSASKKKSRRSHQAQLESTTEYIDADLEEDPM